MKKSTKGAFAAGSAAVLLGGMGTLAYWSEAQDVGTQNIKSGSLDLSAPDCSTGVGAHDWQLDDGTAYVAGTTKSVPGDSISKVCDMTLTLVGDHIGATLAIDTAGVTDNGTSTLDNELAAGATFTLNGAAYAPITAPGEHAVRATVTVTFDGQAATNGSQNGDVNVNAINITATQTHS